LKDVHDDILNKTIPGFNQPLYDKLTTNTEEEDLDGHSVTNFVDGRSQIGINFKSEYTRLQNIAQNPEEGLLSDITEALVSLIPKPQPIIMEQIEKLQHEQLENRILRIR